MREILFRAKTVKNVHWIWGDLFHAGTEPSDGEFAISYWDDEDGWMNENVQPGTIGQFTGLLDKHGKRVFALVIFQGVTLVKMKQYNDDSQRFIEYWRHKTDSLSDENFKLYMQIYELKDSIITLRFER